MDEPPSFSILQIITNQSMLYSFFIALLLFFSAWASAVEAAFFSLTNDDIDRFKGSADAREKTAAALVTNPRLLLSVLSTFKYAMLIVSAIVSVSAISYIIQIYDLSVTTIAIGILVLTLLFAMAGVILPKIFGSTHYLVVARKNSHRCKKLISILTPIVRPLLKLSIRVEKKLDAKTEQKSEQRLTQVLQLVTVDNDPIEGENEILKGIVNFGSLTVKQVMRPRPEISYTDASSSFSQLMEFVKKSGYSRIPICRGSLDKVQGFLYIKDLLPFLEEGDGFTWQRLLRPGYFVPETKKIDFLLKDFQEKRVHMALVVNHLGNITGLITLEDIIEEIIGDINDEFDEIGTRYQRIDSKTYVFDGKTSVHEFCKVLRIDPGIFNRKGINESLSGVLLELNEKLPAVGDSMVVDPFTFVIESVAHKRIKKIRVMMHEAKSTDHLPAK